MIHCTIVEVFANYAIYMISLYRVGYILPIFSGLEQKNLKSYSRIPQLLNVVTLEPRSPIRLIYDTLHYS